MIHRLISQCRPNTWQVPIVRQCAFRKLSSLKPNFIDLPHSLWLGHVKNAYPMLLCYLHRTLSPSAVKSQRFRALTWGISIKREAV